MIALDSNLLIYAHRGAADEHQAARTAIKRASGDARGWGIALPAVAEFWSVVTHPAAAGGPSTPRQAAAYFSELIEAGAKVFHPAERFEARLLRLAEDLQVGGPRIFDLQIALASFDGGATEIWTHDRNFLSFPRIRVHDPL